MKKLSMNYQGKTYLRPDAAMPIKPGKIKKIKRKKCQQEPYFKDAK